jgi:hypothetical protein
LADGVVGIFRACVGWGGGDAALAAVAPHRPGPRGGLRTVRAETALTAIATCSTAAAGRLRSVRSKTALTAVITLCSGHLIWRQRLSRRRDIEISAVSLQPIAGSGVDTGFIKHLLGGVNY